MKKNNIPESQKKQYTKKIWCRKKNANGEWEYICTEKENAYNLCINAGYEINCKNPLTDKTK